MDIVAKTQSGICFAEEYISVAAYRQCYDRNPYSNGHAGPRQCGRGFERQACANPRPALVSGSSFINADPNDRVGLSRPTKLPTRGSTPEIGRPFVSDCSSQFLQLPD